MLSDDTLIGAAGAGAGYVIPQSLRFNDDDSAYLSWTPGGAADSPDDITFSFWWKRGAALTGVGAVHFLDAGSANDAFRVNSVDRFQIFLNGAADADIQTTRKFLDFGAWYHFVVQFNTGNATAGDRIKLYINGVRETAFSTETYPTIGYNTDFLQNAVAQNLGRQGTATQYMDGYLAEFVAIDGLALDASSFGETDTNGIWVPKSVSDLTFGTNGFHLDFAASGDLGNDVSGNTNDFTPSGLAAADQVTDSPTDKASSDIGNYNTWNAYDAGSGTLSDGNLVLASTTDRSGTFPMSSGKWAWKLTANATAAFGVVQGSLTGTESTYAATSADVLEFQFDADAGTLDASVNGAAYTSVATGLTSGPYFTLAKGACSADFGQLGFTLDDASFKYLCTAHLAAPAIKDARAHFGIAIDTGTGVAKDVTFGGNATLTADDFWRKNRDTTDQWKIGNRISGTTKRISWDTYAVEATDANGFDDFAVTDGFGVGTGANGYNDSGEDFVTYGWKHAGGTGVSNTDGTITATVSANDTAGQSLVKYTGTGAAATVGHGLSAAPELIIAASLDRAGQNYHIYHTGMANTELAEFDLNSAKITAASWNNTSPTASVFSLGAINAVNGSGNVHMARCYRSVPGYSRVFNYDGNGSASGPFIPCDFRVAFVLIRQVASAGQEAEIHDIGRAPYNIVAAGTQPARLQPSAPTVEGTTSVVHMFSNGFRIVTTGTSLNGSGLRYIGVAFAEAPFGGAGVAQARAR